MKKYQGPSISTIPKEAGLYAWYFRPRNYDADKFAIVLSRIFDSPGSASIRVRQRYGCHLVANAPLEMVVGSGGRSIQKSATIAANESSGLLKRMAELPDFISLTRPLYIGIAASDGNTLFDRVYKQHYLKLDDLWNDKAISHYLSANPRASVQAVMDDLGLPHSFALESRVKGIACNDLQAAVVTLSEIGLSLDQIERSNLEATEDLLQLISDPLFGRT